MVQTRSKTGALPKKVDYYPDEPQATKRAPKRERNTEPKKDKEQASKKPKNQETALTTKAAQATDTISQTISNVINAASGLAGSIATAENTTIADTTLVANAPESLKTNTVDEEARTSSGFDDPPSTRAESLEMPTALDLEENTDGLDDLFEDSDSPELDDENPAEATLVPAAENKNEGAIESFDVDQAVTVGKETITNIVNTTKEKAKVVSEKFQEYGVLDKLQQAGSTVQNKAQEGLNLIGEKLQDPQLSKNLENIFNKPSYPSPGTPSSTKSPFDTSGTVPPLPAARSSAPIDTFSPVVKPSMPTFGAASISRTGSAEAENGPAKSGYSSYPNYSPTFNPNKPTYSPTRPLLNQPATSGYQPQSPTYKSQSPGYQSPSPKPPSQSPMYQPPSSHNWVNSPKYNASPKIRAQIGPTNLFGKSQPE